MLLARATLRDDLSAMGATPFDRFAKQLVRDALEDRCIVESDAEVPANTRRIDLWILPRGDDAAPPAHLGLLGRITSSPVTLELFHNTPSGEELRACMNKHDEFRNNLTRKAVLQLPMHWVISSGRPDRAIEGLGFRPLGTRGIYESPPLHFTRLVVINELPATRDTLLVRVLGAGAVLRRAISELWALEASAQERGLVLPLLPGLGFASPMEQVNEDQEAFMELVRISKNWQRECFDEGVQQRVERERQLLLRLLRRRFGDAVSGDVELRVAGASADQIEAWVERTLTAATLEALLAD